MNDALIDEYITPKSSEHLRAKIIDGVRIARDGLGILEAIALANTASRPELVKITAGVVDILAAVLAMHWLEHSECQKKLAQITTANGTIDTFST